MGLLESVDEIANGDTVEVGLDFGVDGTCEVGDFVVGDVAEEEGSRGVSVVLVEFFD